MTRRFRASGVAIDLDGTLLDTVADLAAAVNAMLADLGRPALTEATVRSYVGKGARILVHRALSGSLDGRVDDESAARGLASFERHYTRENGRSATIFPNVVEGLAAMRAKGLRLACVTNKPQAFADALLERTGLAGHFEFVIGGDVLPRGKPDPMQLHHVCERLGLPPSRMVAIGDSLNDAQAARAAGIPVLIVPYGYNEGLPVGTIDADGIVADLLEAAQRIDAAV
ncbi:MAG: phosphoglycolate phosphatase [Burkholderiaceae bacterium]|nr:phosphoglycolate phosphatase [Rhodocyclaceae bacterium]MCO5106342.1 phosphoglycolate phosphatase [Burkholderiaceae bacterium]